ncbi:MAG: hypothetical protein ACYCXR_07770 [Coriobacteriia bacterium]
MSAISRTRQSTQQVPAGADVRRRLLEFYRERDRQDAERFAGGQQTSRGVVYAEGVARLESEADVYESYRVLNAAGIELSPAAQSIIAALSQDWRQVCRIDAEGRLWTASLREKKASW